MTGSGATLTVLGSGTLLPDGDRHSAAHLVETSGARFLLDCGPGTVHGLGRSGVTWSELTHVAITHYHLDHVGDLSALLFALKHGVRPPRTRPLTLVGPRGFGAFVEGVAAALGDHLVDPGFDVDVVELGPGGVLEDARSRARLTCHPTPHTPESVAYRLELPEGTVGYTGDTGPSAEVAAFLGGCDVLVAECALRDPPEVDTHLSPRALAGLAGVARPGLLVVTHVVPPHAPEEAADGVRAAGYDGVVLPGWDGMRVALPGGRVLS